jgi:uncharacterized protein YjbI with pentapeptide repeats
MSQYNVVLEDRDRKLSRDLKPRVERELAKLAPLVAAGLEAKRDVDFAAVVQALLRGVELRGADVERAELQANALRAVLGNASWLTAEGIGRAGGFSPSNLAAPAHRWKQEGKIFAVVHEGQERFPAYGLDEAYRPLPALAALLEQLGPISGWRIAIWFESANAWLSGAKPRERLATQPAKVIEAACHYADVADT